MNKGEPRDTLARDGLSTARDNGERRLQPLARRGVHVADKCNLRPIPIRTAFES